MGLQTDALLVELIHIKLGGHFIESKPNNLIIPLLEELLGILVSQLDEPELSQNLCIHDSEIIVNGLVEDHMIDMSINDFSNGPDSLNTININILKHLINPLWLILELVDECSEEFYEVWVVVVDAEVEAIEESHLIFLDIISVLIDNIDDLKVEGLFLLWLLLTKSVSFLISVGDFMVEVYFFSEFGEILISYIFINLVSHVSFDVIDFNLSFNIINLTILIKVILWIETFR